jgi:hypothetical protein
VAVTVTHATVATLPDEAGAEINKDQWNEGHTVSGLGTMAEANTADYTTTAGLTAYLASPPAIGGTAAAAGTFTALTGTSGSITGITAFSTGQLGSTLSIRWGASVNDLVTLTTGGTFAGASNAAGTKWQLVLAAIPTFRLASDGEIGWNSTTNLGGGALDTFMVRGGAANSVKFGGVTGATTTSRTEINKTVTGIADATATTIFTLTVPNGNHSGNVEVTLNGIIGAGGAIGVNEASASIKYNVAFTRTTGANMVAVISAAYASSGSAAVAGATSCTVAMDLGAVAGAAGASNTVAIRGTITKGGGASANHIGLSHAVLLNANASGATIA